MVCGHRARSAAAQTIERYWRGHCSSSRDSVGHARMHATQPTLRAAPTHSRAAGQGRGPAAQTAASSSRRGPAGCTHPWQTPPARTPGGRWWQMAAGGLGSAHGPTPPAPVRYQRNWDKGRGGSRAAGTIRERRRQSGLGCYVQAMHAAGRHGPGGKEVAKGSWQFSSAQCPMRAMPHAPL